MEAKCLDNMMFAGMEKDYYLDGAQDKEMQEVIAALGDAEKRYDQLSWQLAAVYDKTAGGMGAASLWGGTGRGGGGPGGGGSSGEQKGKGESEKRDSTTSENSVYERHYRYADHTIAYKQISDPYERAEEMSRKEAFEHQKRIIGKPFDASGKGDLSRPSRVLLGDCVRDLYHVIAKDWVDADPVILTTAEDLIVVYFHVEKSRHIDALRRYMNGCLLRNVTCRQYDLRKVQEGWCRRTDDDHIMFTLRPLWVPCRRFIHPSKAR